MISICPKRLIEVDLPIKRISEHARREKNLRQGHISSLHIWWARRPLAACRAVMCALLWPDPADESCPQGFRVDAAGILREFASRITQTRTYAERCSLVQWERWQLLASDKGELNTDDPSHLNVLRYALLDFIADFADWNNTEKSEFLTTSRALTQSASRALTGDASTRPIVIDPFAGGGAIPLEALRVGAESVASDLNPVAVLLNKIVQEYLPTCREELIHEVERCGKLMSKALNDKLAQFFAADSSGVRPVAFIWSRTIMCEAPGQSDVPIEVPLIRSMWLAKKPGRLKALRWVRDQHGQITLDRVTKTFADGTTRTVMQPRLEVFSPKSEKVVEPGTSKGGAATCPVTGFTHSVERVRSQLSNRSGGADDARMLVVVLPASSGVGRHYRVPNPLDLDSVNSARSVLKAEMERDSTGLPVVPDEPLNHLRGFFNVVLYGMKSWGTLFTPRQLLTLVTLKRILDEVCDSRDQEAADTTSVAVRACLALAINKQADRNSSLCRWISQNEAIGYTFGRQALPMLWDFVESSPLDSSGAWDGIVNDIVTVLKGQSSITQVGHVTQASATQLPWPDDYANAVFTDPPYYSAVPYADLSDFFYVWLRRTMGHALPDMFRTEVAPKDDEIVALAHRAAMYRQKDSKWFEAQMGLACQELRRIVQPGGIGCFVFANKETAGWEAMVAAIINAGWAVTGSWPIDTERPGRMRAQGSAALASSIHIICRPRERPDGSLDTESVGDWRDILLELPARMHEWMPRLAREGIVGADAIFACLGPALELFSQYAQVEKASGERVNLREYLEHIWASVAREALGMIFSDADAIGFEEDARLTAIWFWVIKTANSESNLNVEMGDEIPDEESDDESPTKSKSTGYSMEYDAVRKLAQGLGASLQILSRPGSIITIQGSVAILNSVASRARHLVGFQLDLYGERTAIFSSGKSSIEEVSQATLIHVSRRQPGLFDDSGEDLGDASQPRLPQIMERRTLLERLKESGITVLDRLHQAMLLFGRSQTALLKDFLLDSGMASNQSFWNLAQALSALYPPNSEEKRWVDGVLSRKKAMGF